MRRSWMLQLLVVVAVMAVAAGCQGQRRIMGANQDLVRQRDALNRQIDDLKAQLAERDAQMADVDARLKRLQAERDYLDGRVKAYADAYGKAKSLQEGISEKVMRELAEKIGGTYLPGGGVSLSSDILFDSGRADLKASAKEALGVAAQAFQSYEARELFLRIDGHTDSQQITASKALWKDNMDLSQGRARAVWVELMSRGVAPQRMYTAGFGEYRPVADNATSQGRQANRRVEIWVVPPPVAATGGEGAATEEPALEVPPLEEAAPAEVDAIE